MPAVQLAVIGTGHITQTQHFPIITEAENFCLTATVSPRGKGTQQGVPNFTSLSDLLENGPKIDAVILCTPPQIRYEIASQAMHNKLHVFLEKPPGTTLSEVDALKKLASKTGVTLFASWHSRFAAGVKPAREWLADKTVKKASIIWREDVKYWHPGQKWIWQPGGLGVFDPGINALSIATEILPNAFFLKTATLSIPANCYTPIAAQLMFQDGQGALIDADFDWRQEGPQTWDIIIETNQGTLTLSKGGACNSVTGINEQSEHFEYASMYQHFHKLIQTKTSEVDVQPLRHVADAFMLGRHETVAEFHE
jgi:D-galactose 1-dehydrogenase